MGEKKPTSEELQVEVLELRKLADRLKKHAEELPSVRRNWRSWCSGRSAVRLRPNPDASPPVIASSAYARFLIGGLHGRIVERSLARTAFLARLLFLPPFRPACFLSCCNTSPGGWGHPAFVGRDGNDFLPLSPCPACSLSSSDPRPTRGRDYAPSG